MQAGQGMGSRTPNDTYHEVAIPEPAAPARIQHTAQGFVAQYQARLTAWRPAVVPFYDLDVSPTDPDSNGFDKYRALAQVWLADSIQLCAPTLLRLYGNRLQLDTPRCDKPSEAGSSNRCLR